MFRSRIKVTSTIALHLTLNISETVRDRGLVPTDYQQEMAYWLSNGHVTDDVTWPWKVKLVTQICLERNISKTTWARDSVPKDRQQEMTYGVSNGHMTNDVTWPPKVLSGSTVGYPSDGLASCYPYDALHSMVYAIVLCLSHAGIVLKQQD